MEVTVSARHTEVPERLRAVAEEKVGRLGRYVDGMDRAEVHFTTLGNPRIAEGERCEITMEGHGHHVRAKVAAEDGFVAVDKAVAKVEQQLKKLRSKLHRQRKGAGRSGRTLPVGDGTLPDDLAATVAAGERPEPGERGETGERLPQIVKVKRFATMGMTADDAAQRMDLLGHGFFFFTNLDTGRAAVVYRRDDGDIGLIDEAG